VLSHYTFIGDKVDLDDSDMDDEVAQHSRECLDTIVTVVHVRICSFFCRIQIVYKETFALTVSSSHAGPPGRTGELASTNLI
jgi:hypothetical protein